MHTHTDFAHFGQNAEPALMLKKMIIGQEPFLARLNLAIEANIQDFDLCSGNLHRIVPTSRATLHRKLAQTLSLCASAYLNLYRVCRSLEYLPVREYAIKDIALLVGMNGSAYTRAFKNFLGQAPNNFRQSEYCFKTE